MFSRVRYRAKTVKLLESSPLQIAMCVLVLIDAGIVVAEILLDLHAIRCESHYFNTINTPYLLTCYDCRRTDSNLHQRTKGRNPLGELVGN